MTGTGNEDNWNKINLCKRRRENTQGTFKELNTAAGREALIKRKRENDQEITQTKRINNEERRFMKRENTQEIKRCKETKEMG